MFNDGIFLIVVSINWDIFSMGIHNKLILKKIEMSACFLRVGPLPVVELAEEKTDLKCSEKNSHISRPSLLKVSKVLKVLSLINSEREFSPMIFLTKSQKNFRRERMEDSMKIS